ncbi:histidine phosphatase family protein [Actinoplanes bogorensis]|uniref:Histidine phosphatase family protein n=1 Tax=Paractinoplanes bogorensis TaxID=1610840 RepID=A0ABS5YPY7_9ACTN|nr:histidine phosphatase family protein [Actinoplanes bogorensis]MBU2665512.1 histidine phosphatase family protein [Actinoplanes bogorensis]
MRIILVRHAMPALEPGVAPHRWRLGAEGRAAAGQLTLPADGYLVASSEPKAAETLSAAGLVHRGPGSGDQQIHAPGSAGERPSRLVHREPGSDRACTAQSARLVHRDAGFDEVRRPHEWRDDHRARARAYVDGAVHPGWEPRDEVAARFEAAIVRHAARAAGRPLVVGSHGMAITCWLAAQGRLAVPPGQFWAALAFPGVVEVVR